MFDWKGFDPVRFTFYRFGKRMTKVSFCQTLRFKVCGGNECEVDVIRKDVQFGRSRITHHAS